VEQHVEQDRCEWIAVGGPLVGGGFNPFRQVALDQERDQRGWFELHEDLLRRIGQVPVS